MSRITINSPPKHCAEKQVLRIERNYKKLFLSFSAIFTTLILFILLIYFILHSSKPRFSLTQVDIYQLNLSGSKLNSEIQFTLLSKNPNQKVGIYYDEFQVYATYKGQQITGDTSLLPFYQSNEESNLLTASLVGNSVPIAPSIDYEVGVDQSSGRLVLNLKVNGKLRWKIGTWVSEHYRFIVNCVSFMAFVPSMTSTPMSSNQGSHCSTTI